MAPEPKIGHRDIDFRPAPPGWRALWIDDDGELRAQPLTGWLIQEVIQLDPDTGESVDDTPVGERRRRVVAAVHDAGWGIEVVEAGLEVDIWLVLSPMQPNPTSAAVSKEHERRLGRRSGST